MNCRANILYDTSPQTISGALTRSEYFKIPPLRFARAFCLFVLAVLVCNVAVLCWFACQRAATVRVTVLPVQGGRFARPSTRSPSLSLRVDSCTARVTDKRRLPAYTYTPSGASPAQFSSPCFGPLRCGSALGLRPRLSPRYARPSLRSAVTPFHTAMLPRLSLAIRVVMPRRRNTGSLPHSRLSAQSANRISACHSAQRSVTLPASSPHVKPHQAIPTDTN